MRVKRFCSVNQDYVGVLKHLDRYVDRGENFVLVLGMDWEPEAPARDSRAMTLAGASGSQSAGISGAKPLAS